MEHERRRYIGAVLAVAGFYLVGGPTMAGIVLVVVGLLFMLSTLV